MLGETWIDHRLNLRLMEIEKRLDGIEFDFIFHKLDIIYQQIYNDKSKLGGI